jgi:hypothetical protein
MSFTLSARGRGLPVLLLVAHWLPIAHAQVSQSQKLPRNWALQVQFNGAAKFEEVVGLLREANAQIQSGPESSGAFVVAVDFKRCKYSRRTLEASPLIDAVKEAEVQAPEADRLPKNMCSLSDD